MRLHGCGYSDNEQTMSTPKWLREFLAARREHAAQAWAEPLFLHRGTPVPFPAGATPPESEPLARRSKIPFFAVAGAGVVLVIAGVLSKLTLIGLGGLIAILASPIMLAKNRRLARQICGWILLGITLILTLDLVIQLILLVLR
jgi:hypothetical protein